MAVNVKRTLWGLCKFALLAILVVSAVAYYQQRDIPRDMAPALAGRSLQGDVLDLQQLAKQGPVLVYFWATWCGYCRAVSPAISDLARDHQVIAVALQSGSDAELADYLSSHSLQFPTISDPSGFLSRAWGVRVTPSIVIVDSDGRVAWVTSGATSKWGLRLRLALTD
ncbi:protein disulfide oxidoreductase [Microbulbifer taiwanensis]|uniref:Protein disulfide oxidoreductase n=1 Tax=Microbulbifer taiwanensis TaxID=986746 RepID=A0ABW1YS84_9GAMM|nr:protein disulfide oxidoreductase [Microbulbifer taiwanensis]